MTQCCVISCFNDFQLHLGASLQESELRLCQKKTSYRRQGAESQEERGHDHTDLTMTEMSDYGNRAKKGDGVEVSKATVSSAKQQQEKQKYQVKKNH